MNPDELTHEVLWLREQVRDLKALVLAIYDALPDATRGGTGEQAYWPQEDVRRNFTDRTQHNWYDWAEANR